MRLAVTIPTYARADGKTPFFLKRALDSVFAQDHRDFKVFVAGDDYQPREELDAIVAQYPKEKLRLIHLDHAVEREKYKDDNKKRWNNGGVTAHNAAAEAAISEGFDYICTLDHDDRWLPRHLRVISEAIEETKADFLCTGASWNGGRLPKIESNDRLVPFLPKPAGIIHSSTCYNHRTIPIRIRDAGDLPADYDKWQRMAPYIKAHGLKSYFVNDFTCIYETGGYERNRR